MFLLRAVRSTTPRLVAGARSTCARPPFRAFATAPDTPATSDNDEVVTHRCNFCFIRSCLSSRRSPDDHLLQVVPELVETLEWVLDSPPPLHQFEEPPIIVEIGGVEPASMR